MMKRRSLWTVLLTLVAVPLVIAQSLVAEECALLVAEVLNSVDDVCEAVAGGEACYVQAPVSYEAQDGFDFTFAAPADIAPLAGFASLSTGGFDADADEWGVVLLAYPSDEPESDSDDALDSGLVRYMLMGDATITDTAVAEGGDAMQAFTLSTGAETGCNGAPDKLLLQTPRGVLFDVTVNGAQISMAEETTIAIAADPGNEMLITVVTGEAAVAADGATTVVLGGEELVVILGGEDGYQVVSLPDVPDAFDELTVQFLPLRAVTEVVEVSAAERWTGTGVLLSEGDSYTIVATEFMKTIDYMPWTGAAGHSAADCGAAGRGDWDCQCRTLPEWGTCTMDEVASMALMGRVGEEGAAFIVGAGGSYTATADGELFLGANDNTFTDNVGAYYVVVTADVADEDTTD